MRKQHILVGAESIEVSCGSEAVIITVDESEWISCSEHHQTVQELEDHIIALENENLELKRAVRRLRYR